MPPDTQLTQQQQLTRWKAEMLSVGGHEIAAVVRPGGMDRPLVLLHGITGSAGFWPAALPVESFQSRTCLSVSLPGHAPSLVPAGFKASDVTPQMFADVIAGAIKHQLGDGPVHLVGWSTGGFSALAIAAYHPQLVASAASVSGFARGKWGDVLGVMQRLASGGRSSRVMFAQGLKSMAGRRWVYNQIMRRFVGEKRRDVAADAIHDVLFDDLAAHDPAVMAELMQGLRTVDLSSDLERITAPVLIVGGRRDPVISLSETQFLASEIRTAELLELEGCGHLFFAEAPDRTFDALDKWIAQHD